MPHVEVDVVHGRYVGMHDVETRIARRSRTWLNRDLVTAKRFDEELVSACQQQTEVWCFSLDSP